MFDQILPGIVQILSNTIRNTTRRTRCPNGKIVGHQTMFDRVWWPNISRLGRALNWTKKYFWPLSALCHLFSPGLSSTLYFYLTNNLLPVKIQLSVLYYYDKIQPVFLSHWEWRTVQFQTIRLQHHPHTATVRWLGEGFTIHKEVGLREQMTDTNGSK